ncbi:MAG TPA: hydrogen gas-evolving membrane-bound hydrogenase subunit E [Syntrophomonadaceae bacterium]|nr:hydrogen gas-evolving membrane-bound hydrogenase subunit E [Syntrophomonadaceae bacterium]
MKIRNVIILIVVMLAVYGALLAVAELPPYGMADNPIHNQVSERYINKGLDDTGVLNMVAGIVLDYRAYDTMFETIVLFTAALAVVITLKPFEKEGDRK